MRKDGKKEEEEERGVPMRREARAQEREYSERQHSATSFQYPVCSFSQLISSISLRSTR